MPGSVKKISTMISLIDSDLRMRLEKKLLEMSMSQLHVSVESDGATKRRSVDHVRFDINSDDEECKRDDVPRRRVSERLLLCSSDMTNS